MSTDSIKVLVYHYRRDTANPVIADGIAVITKSELDSILQNHPELQSTTKPIKSGAKHVDIYQEDLWTPEQKIEGAGKPNSEANVAGVTVPRTGHLWGLIGSIDFDELTILSKKT